ncbi:MAG: AI-2E family transporter [Chloroflexi bacterium]|nr:AI-2E family transporter [Chloroflexota bacterium]
MHAELTQIPVSPRTRNILLAIVAALILLVFWKAPTLPKLLLTGMAVALVLSFPVKYLSKVIPRGIAIALVVLAVLAVLVLAAIVLVPLAVGQLASLAEQAPRLLEEAYGWARRVVENLDQAGLLDTSPDEAMAELQETGAQRAEGLLEGIVARAFDTLSGTVGGVFTTLSVILIAAYLLVDGERFKFGTIRLLPVQYRDDALVLFSDVIEALSRYLAGLLVSLTFQGIASTVALTLLGVPFAILLGIWTTIGAIVPFVGSYIGAVPATIVAFTVSPTTGILTALSYVLINFIDGNLIAPRVQGNAIRVSPLFVFLAVIAGGQIAGIWGALMAVPILAVIRVVFDFLLERVVVVPQTLDPLPVALVEPPPDPSTKAIKTLNTSGAAAARVGTIGTPRS